MARFGAAAVLMFVALAGTGLPANASTAHPNGVATAASNGSTFHLFVGQTLKVRLNGRSSAPWSAPEADAKDVVRRSNVRRSHGDASATFTAIATGQTAIEARQTPTCPTRNPCQFAPAPPWHIDVIVS